MGSCFEGCLRDGYRGLKAWESQDWMEQAAFWSCGRELTVVFSNIINIISNIIGSSRSNLWECCRCCGGMLL